MAGHYLFEARHFCYGPVIKDAPPYLWLNIRYFQAKYTDWNKEIIIFEKQTKIYLQYIGEWYVLLNN